MSVGLQTNPYNIMYTSQAQSIPTQLKTESDHYDTFDRQLTEDTFIVRYVDGSHINGCCMVYGVQVCEITTERRGKELGTGMKQT